jgi:hypothetical protein
MADETSWRIDIELRAKTRSLGPALREASADLVAFTNVLESLEKTAGLSTLAARLKRLTEAARGAPTVLRAAAGQQTIFEWRLGGEAAPGRAVDGTATADGRSPVSAQATGGAAIQLKAAAAEERAATKAQRDAAQTTMSAAGSLADAASKQGDAVQAFAVSAADANRAWQRVSGPIEHTIGQIAADALIGGNQPRGFGYAMYQMRIGLERKLVGNMAENLAKGIASVTVQPLFKSLIGMGGPIGGIANILFGNSQAAGQAMFASSVATFTAAVGTFAASAGVQAGAAATSAGASAVSTAGSVGGIFGGIKSLFTWIFNEGGIVPSAAGGWALPAGLAGGVPAVLHSREMVLPADISAGLQGMIREGGERGDVHMHFHGPTDAEGVASWVARAVGDNPAPFVRALRGTAFSLS